MRKWLGFLLVLTLLVQCVPSLAGFEGANITMAQYVDEDGEVPYVLNTAAANNALYMVAETGELFRWDAQTNEITSLPIENAYRDRIVADGETLYLLDSHRGTLFPLHITEDAVTLGEAISLEWSGFSDLTYSLDVRKLFLSEGKLYMVTGENHPDADWRERNLYRFDMEKGTCAVLYSGIDMADVCLWRDGKLAMAVFDMDRHYSGNMDQALLPAVKAFDPDSKGFLETLFTHETQFGGLAYDAEADAFFFCADGMLFRHVAKKEHINYVSVSGFDEFMQGTMINAERYALYTNRGIFIRPTSPEDKPSAVLRVNGMDLNSWCPDGYAAFRAKHPEIPIVLDTGNYLGSAEAIYQNMLTDTASDIYCVDSVDTLETLARKGYCYDLSESAALVAATEGMYPHLSAPLYQGGKLYAVVVSVAIPMGFGYSPSILEKIGLTEADLPQTMMDFIDFFVRWTEEISADHPGLELFRNQDLPSREMLLSMIFEQQAAQCAKQGIPMMFDTPVMRALLQRLDEAKSILSGLDEAEADLSGGYTSTTSDPITGLFTWYSIFLRQRSVYDDYTALNLRYTDEAELVHTVSLTTLIVNPNSKNKEYAVALLENVAANISAYSRVYLYPDANEPIEDSRQLKRIEEIQSQIILNKEWMENERDASKKKAWEESLENSERFLAYLERNRYSISPEMIAAYRAIAENMIPATNAFAGSENLLSLLRRYTDGQIGADQYITESERIIRMMMLENQ